MRCSSDNAKPMRVGDPLPSAHASALLRHIASLSPNFAKPQHVVATAATGMGKVETRLWSKDYFEHADASTDGAPEVGRCKEAT